MKASVWIVVTGCDDDYLYLHDPMCTTAAGVYALTC
ncbi:MAG: hypothetical protein ACN6PL_03175 [Pseudomonas putida]